MIAAGLAHTAGLIHAAGAGLRPTSTTRLLNPSVKLARKRLTLCSFEATVVTARAGVIPAGEARTWAIPAGWARTWTTPDARTRTDAAPVSPGLALTETIAVVLRRVGLSQVGWARMCLTVGLLQAQATLTKKRTRMMDTSALRPTSGELSRDLLSKAIALDLRRDHQPSFPRRRTMYRRPIPELSPALAWDLVAKQPLALPPLHPALAHMDLSRCAQSLTSVPLRRWVSPTKSTTTTAGHEAKSTRHLPRQGRRRPVSTRSHLH
jgi:hypothetical protein